MQADAGGCRSSEARTAGAATADDLQALGEAREFGADLPQIAVEAHHRRWLDNNREALIDANAFLARYGLWSDGKRQF